MCLRLFDHFLNRTVALNRLSALQSKKFMKTREKKKIQPNLRVGAIDINRIFENVPRAKDTKKRVAVNGS